jgi:glycosyltransferase involved in cell wall biosynthesis
MIRELSIIIPTLNEADYLPDLLDLIITQTYDGKLEVIIVDGQSTDETLAVARSYEGQIAGLSILETTKNVGHQRNFGCLSRSL